MFSKWKLWEYLKSNNQLEFENGLTAFHCFDPIAFKMIKEKFNRQQFSEGRLNIMLGKELTPSWVEDNLMSLSLFGNSESYLVHNAEEIHEDVRELILKESLILNDRKIILNFNKEDNFLKKLKKKKIESIKIIAIQAPAFWEDDALLGFLTKYFQVYLEYDALEYLKARVPFDIQKYYQHLEQISLIFEQKTVTKSDLIEILGGMKFDNFKLVELFGNKMLKKFYDLLIEAYQNGEDLIGPLYFLQSHIHKMYDQSYLDKKNKFTKYDKQLIQQAKLWSKGDLVKAQSYIGELLIEIKRNDTFFLDHLRLSRGKTFKL